MNNFEIDGDYIELVKLVKVLGWCDTGGMAKLVIADGLVLVDGNIETRKRRKVRRGQVVSFGEDSVSII